MSSLVIAGGSGVDTKGLPKALESRQGRFSNGGATGTYVMWTVGQGMVLATNGSNAHPVVAGFPLKMSEYALAGKTTQVSVTGVGVQESGTQTADISVALQQVTAVATDGSATLAANTCSAAVLPATTVAGTISVVRSTWVTAPTDGFYVLTCTVATTTVVNVPLIMARVEYRHI